MVAAAPPPPSPQRRPPVAPALSPRPARLHHRHYATFSQGEVALRRRIGRVLRHRHVRAVERDAQVCAEARVALPRDNLVVDGTARAVARGPAVPVFQPGRIVLQMVRVPQPAFGATLVAWLVAHSAARWRCRRDGEAWMRLLEVEQEAHVDLVVCGKHGRQIVEELLLGSVTRQVLAEAQADVLVSTSHDGA